MPAASKKPAAPNPANMPVPVNLYVVQPEKAIYYDKFPGYGGGTVAGGHTP